MSPERVAAAAAEMMTEAEIAEAASQIATASPGLAALLLAKISKAKQASARAAMYLQLCNYVMGARASL